MMKNATDVGITRLWKAATFLRHLEGKAMRRMRDEDKEQEQQTGARKR